MGRYVVGYTKDAAASVTAIDGLSDSVQKLAGGVYQLNVKVHTVAGLYAPDRPTSCSNVVKALLVLPKVF